MDAARLRTPSDGAAPRVDVGLRRLRAPRQGTRQATGANDVPPSKEPWLKQAEELRRGEPDSARPIL